LLPYSSLVVLLVAVSPLAAQISVTPDNAPLTTLPYTSGQSVSFTLRWTGSGNKTLYLFCYPYNSVTSCTPSQTVISTPTNMNIPLSAKFATGYVGTGTISFKACDNSGCTQGQDYGSYNVTVAFNGPVVSLLPHNGEDRDVSKCAENCFDGVMSYA